MDNIDLFDKYIKGELSEKERHEFDTRLKDDKNFAVDFKVYSATVIGICKEAEQDNKDFEMAMKNISKEELWDIIGKKKRFSGLRAQTAVYENSEEDRVAASVAVEHTYDKDNSKRGIVIDRFQRIQKAEEEANRKIASRVSKKFAARWLWQAACWGIIIGGAAIWIARADKNAQYAVDEAIYACVEMDMNLPRSGGDLPRSGGEPIDISNLSVEDLKSKIPILESLYHESKTDHEIADNGFVLAMAYLKIRDRDKAKDILRELIAKFNSNEDFKGYVEKWQTILNQLK